MSDGLHDGYDVVVCSGCGLGFASALPPQAEFDRYYQTMSKYEYADQGGQDLETNEARFDSIAERIVEYAQHATTRFLEVGCSTGRLLASIRERGYPNVRGLDPSPYCASAAKRLHDIVVETGTLARNVTVARTVDYLILVGVLEHVYELLPAFGSCCDLLSAGARVYVEVPDATQFDRWLDGPFQQFSMEHINFFSRTSLTNLLTRVGCRPVSVETTARVHTATSRMPVISAIYEYERHDYQVPQLTRDTSTEPALRRYVEASQAVDRRLRVAIDAVVDSGVPIVVWGAGTHTSRLLEESRLADAKIECFVDSNPNYHGKALAGIRICAPEILKGMACPIVISSRVFQREIENQIRTKLRCDNRIIRLYDD